MTKYGLTILLAIAALASACSRGIPAVSSDEYAEAIRRFYVGLAALQVGDEIRAKTELENFVRIAPAEPAGWVDLGVLQMRQKALDDAAGSLTKAEQLEPRDPTILTDQFLLELQRANYDKAIEYIRKVIEIDPQDVRAHSALAREYERQNDDRNALNEYARTTELRPENMAAKLEVMRVAAKLGESQQIAAIAPEIGKWVDTLGDKDISAQYIKLHEAIAAGDSRQVSQNVAFLRNVLSRSPEFRSQANEIRLDETAPGIPIVRPLRLPTPQYTPAEPDVSLAYDVRSVADERARWCKPVYWNGEAAPVLIWGTDREVHAGDRSIEFPATNDARAIDIDYDLTNDLVVAGDSGVQFYNANLQDISAGTKLPVSILGGRYDHVFVFDVEADGDLDLILAAPESPPTVLQNNADGTFKAIELFGNVTGMTNLVSADIDEDGDTDVIAIDRDGVLIVFSNERGGLFRDREVPVAEKLSDIGIADINGDDRIDLVTLGSDGMLRTSSDAGNGKDWTTNDLARLDAGEASRLLLADLDNNGAVDVKAGHYVWLNQGAGKFARLEKPVDAGLDEAADISGDGMLDMIGLNAEMKPVSAIGSGTKGYGWQILRPRAAKTEGDQRINSFGIGSEIEIRSGLLAQKRVSDSPQVHFGLGEQRIVDVMRIVWGNGYVQADFDLKPDQAVSIEQRLKGSCPHLFAWDGKKFNLVKDAPPWSPALGLKINAQETYGILATEEWFKIPGETLSPKDGMYELRITGEYWETYYIDHYALMVIDHPESTEVFADERFAVPIPPLKIYSTGPVLEFASAVDDRGNDVSAAVRNIDESYLGGFDLGQFQGVAEDHFVEFALPDDAPTESGLKLIADGWVHPTDASINVELGQSSLPRPESLSLEYLDENGNWRVDKKGLGFPAGKMKTVVIELTRGAKRFRLRTNMEIYWDRLSWAVSDDGIANRVVKLMPDAAELRYRGFSVIDKKGQESPELPNYGQIETVAQKWRDLEGYYTRYGDVRELLANVDDRYIITSAGDEIVLRFKAPPPVQKGWKRDYVIIGDGWIKDGDLNSVFSKTVLPLPTHRTNDYSRPPRALEDDPVYKIHSSDWQNFHTRYVAPDRFRNALR